MPGSILCVQVMTRVLCGQETWFAEGWSRKKKKKNTALMVVYAVRAKPLGNAKLFLLLFWEEWRNYWRILRNGESWLDPGKTLTLNKTSDVHTLILQMRELRSREKAGLC